MRLVWECLGVGPGLCEIVKTLIPDTPVNKGKKEDQGGTSPGP
jgi:hypothetical protein